MDRFGNIMYPFFYWLINVRLKGPLLQQLSSENITQAPTLLCVSLPLSLIALTRQGELAGIHLLICHPFPLWLFRWTALSALLEWQTNQAIMSMLKREWRITLWDKWLRERQGEGQVAVKMEEFWDQTIYEVSSVTSQNSVKIGTILFCCQQSGMHHFIWKEKKKFSTLKDSLSCKNVPDIWSCFEAEIIKKSSHSLPVWRSDQILSGSPGAFVYYNEWSKVPVLHLGIY